MANLQELIPAFFTGPNGQRLTPEQIAQRQEVAQSLLGRATDTRPDAGGWASVLTKGLLGYKSGADNRAADAAITANADASQQSIAAMLGGLTGGGAYPQAVASGQSPTSSVATGLPLAQVATTPLPEGVEWLDYRNQGATRNKPLNESLVNAMSFLPEMGVTMRVVSGGQDAKGEGNRRTGSTRHDHGNAADVDFFIGDRKLTPKNDAAILSQIVQRGKANGITGWGEGDDYMGSGRIHLGYGSSGVWGAGGSGKNAPSWLVNAYNTPYAPANNAQTAIQSIAPIEQGDENPAAGIPMGMKRDDYVVGLSPESVASASQIINDSAQGYYVDPIVAPFQEAVAPSVDPVQSNLLAQNDMMLGGALSPTGTSPVAQALSGYFPDAPTMQSSTQPQQQQGMGGINPAVIQALSDPYASTQQRQVASMLLGQQMEQAQAAQQQQQLMQQRQATAQTLGINPALAGDPDAWKAAIDQATRNRNTATVGGVLVDANNGQPIYQAPQERFTSITGPQAQQLGLDPNKAYNVGPDGKITPIAESGVTVNVGGGEKLDEEFAKLDAKSLADVSTSGMQAQRNLGRIGQLESLLKSAPNGFGALAAQRAGEWGINTEGLDSIQAAQAVINSLVPEQRPAGSGPMSDADLELFKQSLPRIINTPQGNQTIIDTMRGIAQYDAKGAEIIQRFRKGELNRSQAFEELHNRPNPLANFKSAPQANNAGGDGWRDAGNGVRIRPKGAN